VGLPVLKKGLVAIIKGDVFTEFLLMSIATLGAFAIGQYPEGVAVMVFYAIGEQFQGAAVRNAKNSIKALMDVLPSFAMVLRNKGYEITKPENVNVGEIIQIKAGEKVPLDGEMLSEGSSFNTSALTGESKPKFISKGEQVLAGMINQNKVIESKVTKTFADSSLSKILGLVQNASSKKAKTELLIRRFARIYTPIVFFLAFTLVVVPYFIVSAYSFSDWFYRGLIFLVISCPCALVISIPLGYFGGIGAASRNGILFKGSNFLELIAKVNTIVLDKTGTLTAGVFKVQKIQTVEGVDKKDFMDMLAALESKSNHPVSKALSEDAKRETKPW
jgi:Cd2+/Zn2+-exporting ATPase